MTEPEADQAASTGEEWAHGSGTPDDPYVTPPGFTLDTTQEQWEAAQAGAQPKITLP